MDSALTGENQSLIPHKKKKRDRIYSYVVVHADAAAFLDPTIPPPA